jgi:hypothetical protein
VEVDPDIVDGEVPTVEHEVVLPGIAIVPVTPVGAGLIPGDASSVAPRGMVGETVEPVPRPSGDVGLRLGVGAGIPCAMATLQKTSAGSTAAIREDLIGILRFGAFLRASTETDRFLDQSFGARVTEIAQFWLLHLGLALSQLGIFVCTSVSKWRECGIRVCCLLGPCDRQSGCKKIQRDRNEIPHCGLLSRRAGKPDQ